MADSIGKASILSVMSSWASLPLGIASSVITARVLGPEVKGQFTIFLATVGILALPGFAVQTSLVHLIASRNPDTASLKRFINRFVIVQSVLSVGLLAVVIQVPTVRSVIFSGLHSVYLLAVMAAIGASLWVFYRSAMLSGLQMYARAVVWDMAGLYATTAVFLGILCFWWARGISPKLTWVVVANVVSLVAGTIVWALITSRINPPNGNPIGRREMLRATTSFASPVFLRNLVEWMNRRLDVYVVSAFAGASALGVYSIAVGLGQQLWIIPFSVAGPLFAKVSREGDSEGGRAGVQFIVRVTVLVSVVLGIAAAIASPLLLPFVYGSQFAGAVPLLWILLPGVVAIGPTRAISSYLSGMGRPKEPLRAELIGLCSTITLNVLLVPRFGAIGAAFASSAAYIGYTLFLCHRFLKVSGSRWRDILMIRHEDWTKVRVRLVEIVIERIKILRAPKILPDQSV